ncbi:uncharacterized protein LOC116614847 [Nematostella vectensis]|uniref:uncharacterized protein LOC116614847 n=1 Tax=Nematostella vectensis TaxID=45351 RepID=UPI0020771941|nr:uncharacterized protein LOC116614847 [Nematostella vectensis]
MIPCKIAVFLVSLGVGRNLGQEYNVGSQSAPSKKSSVEATPHFFASLKTKFSISPTKTLAETNYSRFSRISNRALHRMYSSDTLATARDMASFTSTSRIKAYKTFYSTSKSLGSLVGITVKCLRATAWPTRTMNLSLMDINHQGNHTSVTVDFPRDKYVAHWFEFYLKVGGWVMLAVVIIGIITLAITHILGQRQNVDAPRVKARFVSRRSGHWV